MQFKLGCVSLLLCEFFRFCGRLSNVSLSHREGSEVRVNSQRICNVYLQHIFPLLARLYNCKTTWDRVSC
jgi:hypothetical protein